MQRTQNRLRGSKNKRDLVPKLTWTGRKFKNVSSVNRSRSVVIYVTELDEDLLRESHVQKIGGKILQKIFFLRFFFGFD
jgi:hypothetical protein